MSATSDVTRAGTPPTVTVESHPDGDGTHIDVRLLVSPSAGRFHPVDGVGPPAGDVIHHGTLIGHVLHAGRNQPVHSFCTGVLVELLAGADDHVRTGQPLAWVRPVGR